MFLAMISGMVLGTAVLSVTIALFIPVSSPFELLPVGMIITMFTGMGAGMAMTRSSDRLFVTHSRGNRVLVFDLELGAYGEEIRAIEAVGEYPYAIVLSPDERYAVVANYVGEMTEDIGASSSLSVIDIDSTSPTYLQVVARITNR